jgi:CheY-like chemotaxis protein
MASLVVVDDESLVTDFMKFLLEGVGYTVHSASNGKEAIGIIHRVRPQLVLTDLMMPLMSGLELARALREDADFSDTPIILCSGVANPVSLEEQHLFAAVIQKPFNPQQLMDLIAELTG